MILGAFCFVVGIVGSAWAYSSLTEASIEPFTPKELDN